MGQHISIPMETKASTLIGMVAGIFAKLFTGDIAMAIFTAFLTGGFAYLGQQFFKWLHKHMKKD